MFAANADVCPFTWDRVLSAGAEGPDVQKLQEFLNRDEATKVAKKGSGAPGFETSRYGALTALAVSRFQEKYRAEILTPQNLIQGTGRFGDATRRKANELCALPPPPQAVMGAAVEVSQLDVTQGEVVPPSLALAGAVRVPFTKLFLTAKGSDNIVIDSITVEKVGPVQHQAFITVSILDDTGYVLNYAYMQSNGKTTVKDVVTVPAGETVEVVVAGDPAVSLTDYQGQIAALQVIAIEASAPVHAMFPIHGTFHTLSNTPTIGSAIASLSPDDPNASLTRYVNDKNITFSAVRLTAGSAEDITIDSIRWEQAGSAGPDDVQNVRTVVRGQSYPAEADGRFFTSAFEPAIVIRKGNTADFAIRGDIGVSGMRRTIQFNLYYPDDIFVFGNTYGQGIYPYAGDNTATAGNSVFLTSDGSTSGSVVYPFFSGSVVTLSPGTFNSVSR